MADVPNEKAKYIALFNTGAATADVAVTSTQLDISGSFRVRDLWSHTDLGSFETIFSASLLSHGSGMYKIEYDSLSTSISQFKDMIEVYPNPANDQIRLTFRNSVREVSKIEIYNTAGSLIKCLDGYPNEFIPVGDLQNGMYYLKAYHSDTFFMSRFIVKH